MQWPLGQLQQSAALWSCQGWQQPLPHLLLLRLPPLAMCQEQSYRTKCDGTRLGCYLSRKGAGHTFRNHTHLLHGRLVGCIGLVGCRRQCTQQAAQCRSCQIVSDLVRCYRKR